MTTQTVYSTNISPPRAGTIAGNMDNAKVITGICETASPGIGFGLAVSQGALSDQGAIIGGTLAGFKGCSVRDITLRGDQSVVDAYLPPNSMGILEAGDIWVQVGEAVAAHDIACFVLATGVWVKTPGGANSGLIPGAYYKTAAALNGFAILSLPGGRAFTATAIA